ncbi:MAG: hypothetical protein KBD78_03860 [Oligoflexales bacterium]|nr:hypothetical protein [Oligoflexales bacterium]
MPLNMQIKTQGEWELAVFSGPINEDSELILGNFADQLGKNVILNLKDITSVNSCGVRAWINFIRNIEGGRQLIFSECSPEIVSQINMIPSFKGNAKIDSVFANFRCESCGTEKMILYKSGSNMPATSDSVLAAEKCASCGSEMEMDEMPEEFFSFLDAA